MITHINYTGLDKEASTYWHWNESHPIPKVNAGLAVEGAASEVRSPLFHYGTVLPVYLGVIRYLRSLKTTKGLKLVELGSGSGRVLAYLQSQFPEMKIWGTDYSASCITYAQRAYGQYGITFVHDGAQKTTLKASSMDIVISSHVIEHISKADGKLFLAESRRLLKPGGLLFVGTPERRRSQDIYQKNPHDEPSLRLVPPHEHEYTYEELLGLAASIYGTKKVKVDKLFNPVFHRLFSKSIATFKPRPSLGGFITNLAYRLVRDGLPKLWFDKLTKTGAAITLLSNKLSYRDILLANRIESGRSKKISDNLLLVAQK